MIAALLLATLAGAPGRPPALDAEPPHAEAEPALLRAAFPGQDERSGWLGHAEGTLVARGSACAGSGPCFLAVAASDERDGRPPGTGHVWTTFFAFKAVEGGWAELGRAAGPVVDAVGRWRVGLDVTVDADGAFVFVSTRSGGEGGEGGATHLWSWDGRRFLPIFSVASGRQGTTETEAGIALCADRPSDRPSWELRTREREGRGKWTESRVRVQWNGQAWVERAADRACAERNGPAPVAAPALPPAPPAASRGPATPLRPRAASASRTAPPPRGRPHATVAANAIDGDRRTAWVAGGKRGGVGEWLKVELASPAVLDSIQLVGACPGTDWREGPRPRKIRLRFEDGPAQEETLADAPSQAITVRRGTPARWVKLELLELYAGSRRQDACLAEVTLLGR